MVLELLATPKAVEKSPWKALILGIYLSILSISIGALLFPEDAAIVGLLFIVIGGVPFLNKILEIEEHEEEKERRLINIFKRNRKLITIYLAFFFGITIAYAVMYVALPQHTLNLFFNKQLTILGHGYEAPVGQFFNADLFWHIVSVNMRIVAMVLLLSFIYGSGAILILGWNASIFGIYLASLGKIQTQLSVLPHAILEFGAYFIAAIAGGLISVVFVKKRYLKKGIKNIFIDVGILTLMSILLIFIAALIEVSIPVF